MVEVRRFVEISESRQSPVRRQKLRPLQVPAVSQTGESIPFKNSECFRTGTGRKSAQFTLVQEWISGAVFRFEVERAASQVPLELERLARFAFESEGRASHDEQMRAEIASVPEGVKIAVPIEVRCGEKYPRRKIPRLEWKDFSEGCGSFQGPVFPQILSPVIVEFPAHGEPIGGKRLKLSVHLYSASNHLNKNLIYPADFSFYAFQ